MGQKLRFELKSLKQLCFLITVINLSILFICGPAAGQITTLKSSGTWTQGALITSPGRWAGTGASYSKDSTHYFFYLSGDSSSGGNLVPYTDRYNVVTDAWQRMADVPVAVFHSSSCVLKDSVYLIGGFTGALFNTSTASVQMYSINTNSWVMREPLPEPLAYHRVVAYQDSLIYSIGGVTGGTSSGTAIVYLYNASINSWRPATPLPVKKCGFACAMIGDTIIVICGGSLFNSGLTNQVFRGAISQSNRSNISWSTGNTYPGVSRHSFNAAQWGCRGVICGPGSPAGFTRTDECLVYSNNSWIPQPSVPIMLFGGGHGSFRFGNIGKYIVASGYRQGAGVMLRNTQIYTDTVCTPLGINGNTGEIPNEYMLYQNYPNPFNPSTKIKFDIPQAMHVKLSVCDMLGREAFVMVNEELMPGSYTAQWDGTNFSSGIYFYMLRAGNFTVTKKMILMK